MSFWEAGGLGIFNMVLVGYCKLIHAELGEKV